MSDTAQQVVINGESSQHKALISGNTTRKCTRAIAVCHIYK